MKFKEVDDLKCSHQKLLLSGSQSDWIVCPTCAKMTKIEDEEE